jgi:hypothetical protein
MVHAIRNRLFGSLYDLDAEMRTLFLQLTAADCKLGESLEPLRESSIETVSPVKCKKRGGREEADAREVDAREIEAVERLASQSVIEPQPCWTIGAPAGGEWVILA